MTRIYVIRHAEAEGNLYRIAQGQFNSILTDWGWKQVKALEERFAEIHIDKAYSSDLYRTRATASAIYRAKGLPLHCRKELREICVGRWEQHTWGEIARDDPEQLEYFTHELHRWYVEGGETIRQVLDRVLAEVRRISRENDGKTVAVFSHGCAIRLLLAELQGYSLEDLGQTPHGDNTAVSLLEGEGDDLRVVFRDDNSHLSGLTGRGGRPNALEPGMYFVPLSLPEQGDFLRDCVGAAWADWDDLPWDPDRLLKDAARRPTLVAMARGGMPAGVVQFDPDREAEQNCGWISLYCMAPERQRRGSGVQLLGQAVQFYRARGRDRLRLALAEKNEGARRFFTNYGFRPVDGTADGREVWEKDIRYDPEFLGEAES